MREHTGIGHACMMCVGILLGTLVAGCGQDDGGACTPVELRLAWGESAQQAGNAVQGIPAEVNRVDVAISGPGMDPLQKQIQVSETDRANGYVEAGFLVPNGAGRMVSVEASDAGGVLRWTGQSNPFSVPSSEPIFIEMKPVE